jgi:hypothetical protein
VNLYRNPDDVYRVHSVLKNIQRQYGLDKPVWVTELNTLPVDDRRKTCAPVSDGSLENSATLEQQSAYVAQAFTLAAAVGYQRIQFFQMSDGDACQAQQLWGLIRADGAP